MAVKGLKELIDMSIRLDILSCIDEGVVMSSDIIEKLSINGRSFHNSIRFMLNQGWLLSAGLGQKHFTDYTITALGREKLDKKMIDSPPEGQKRLSPDYDRMRQYLQSNVEISNTQLVGLWNDNTDYYLPYEGEIDFRLMHD
jgi:predicted transcriptional regulator